jgi:hypothetical protein
VGYSPKELVALFERFVLAAPGPRKAAVGHAKRELHDTGDVLTLWAADPDCVDADGRPRPLPVRGPAPSFQSLLTRVRPDLSLEEGLEFFRRTGSLRRVGRKLVPTNIEDDSVIHSPESQSQGVHQVIVTNQLLGNFEYNSKPRRRGQRWPERVAECSDFPVPELRSFISKFAERARPMMKSYNHDMARIAGKAPRSMPRKRVSINLFLSVSPASRARIKSAATPSKTR